MNVPEPRFSIIIPTRNRPKTLRWSLKTCVEQRFRDFEVIVSDNHSDPETREVVEEFTSPNVRYLRTSRPLAMSDNWEFATSHATGEYVIVIGDDDGLLPRGLEEIDAAIRSSPTRILRCSGVNYFWPDVAIPELTNRLQIPFGRRNEVVNVFDVAPRVAHGELPHQALPMLYNSAIPRATIGQLRERVGRVFGALSPDIYTGFAFAYLSRNYASIARPVLIGGTSGASTGFANTAFRGATPVGREFESLNRSAELRWHPRIPVVMSLRTFMAESFETARDQLFPNEPRLMLDRKRIVRQCVEDLPRDAAGWAAGLGNIEASLGDDQVLLRWFRREVFSFPEGRPEGQPWYAWRRGIGSSEINLNAADFGANNVYEASLLADKIIGDPSQDAFEWRGDAKPSLGFRRRVWTALRVLARGR